MLTPHIPICHGETPPTERVRLTEGQHPAHLIGLSSHASHQGQPHPVKDMNTVRDSEGLTLLRKA
ncbi:Uncharacterised protein [Budvicia aquatica]|uniref:Uncharacterized protein n=1 Tax=Budvicia aquatica TaxID=82979 RepID=A0A484ZNW7_9GAMM|nr:Uncharacterised protein [Budvicia aquatica]